MDYLLTLVIVFKNDETKLYDCKPLLDFGIFQELKDLNYFFKAKAEHGTVVWPHEQDICPDTLYLDSKEIEEGRNSNQTLKRIPGNCSWFPTQTGMAKYESSVPEN